MDSPTPIPPPEQISLALDLITDMAEDCRLWAAVYRKKNRPGSAATSQASCDALSAVAAYLESVKP